MKIGLMFGWAINSLKPNPKGKDRNFLGDEMTGGSLQRELLKYPDVERCELYCDAHGIYMPDDTDICIDMNPHCKGREKAKVQILYYQNGDGERGSVGKFEQMRNWYDGVAFAAKKMDELYRGWTSRSGHKHIFLPLAADPERFYPVDPDPDFEFDVAYCGNDIKRHRTMPFLGPAMQHNFGLFGRWSEEHRETLGPISRGQLTFDDLRKLYSSSKIMINIHFQDCIDYGLWAGRIFDVIACNGFLVSDTPYGLPDEFRKHAVFIEDNQTADTLEHYLADDDLRNRIRADGRKWIIEHHTFKQRAADLHKYLQEFV